MDSLNCGHLMGLGLILTTLVGCGGIGPLTQGLPDPNRQASDFKSMVAQPGEPVDAFDGDLWSHRDDWSVWQGAKGIEGTANPEQVSRWTHPATKWIRELIAPNLSISEKEKRKSDWIGLMKRNDIGGWNGMILFARYFPNEGSQYLPELASLASETRDYSVKDSDESGDSTRKPVRTSTGFRAAAAEGCGFILQAAGNHQERDLRKILELCEKSDLPDDVRVELYRGLARLIPPRDIPGLNESLKPRSSFENGNQTPPPEVRLAAIDACLYRSILYPTSGKLLSDSWPPNVLNLRSDPDYRLRIKIGQLAAISRHPSAAGILKEMLSDTETAVRLETLVSLGRFGTPEAKQELLGQMKNSGELVRVSAIRGLAFFGPEVLRGYTSDVSPFVRQELAQQLCRFEDDESAFELRKLLLDQNPQVQEEVVQGLSGWSDRRAIGLLIYALRESASKTRQSALNSLETRFGGPLIFPVHGTRQERLRESDIIARNWPDRIDFVRDLRIEPKTDGPIEEQRRISELKQDLRSLALLNPDDPQAAAIQRRLMDLKTADVTWLEEFLVSAPSAQQDWILNSVLPHLSRTHRALHELENSDSVTRRRSAERLAGEAINSPLHPMELKRLERILSKEQDALVWRYAMTAIERDGSPEAARIAQMAVTHTWPDIRILGCRRLGSLNNPELALWLLPLFNDENPQVQIAAVEAAIQCGNPIVLDGIPAQGTGGVRSLISTDRLQLRVKVCACLCRFGDQQGIHELSRLARDSDWTIRNQAIEAMGAGGQTRFVDFLTQLGWTEKHPSVQRTLLQALDQLVPPSGRPSELRDEDVRMRLTNDQQLEIWMQWQTSRTKEHRLQTAESFP